MSDLAQIAAGIRRAVSALLGNAHFLSTREQSDSVTVTKDSFLNATIRLQRLSDWVEGLETTSRQIAAEKVRAQSEHIQELRRIAQDFRVKLYALDANSEGMIHRARLVKLVEDFSRECETEADNYATGCSARARQAVASNAEAA